MAPLCPRIKIRRVSPDSRANGRPLEARECIPEIKVQDYVSLAAIREDSIDATAGMDKDIASAWHGDPALAGPREKLLEISLPIRYEPLSDEASPDFTDPNRPRRLGILLL